ncbi:MAG: diguanylate cyclase [Myxococcales bacterium]|nr:diguanylate cyclase [Myxococcales bacterium]
MTSDTPAESKTLLTNRNAFGLDSTSVRVDSVVIIYSPDPHSLGKRYTLDKDALTIGRGRGNDIILDVDSVSRRHARLERRADRTILVDLGSTNGTFVNDLQVKTHALGRGDQIRIGDTIFKFLSGSDAEAQYHEAIYRMTIVDGLTGAYNMRYFHEQLESELARAHRYDRPLALVMIDIDHFKRVNDEHGHLVGDRVLERVAKLVQDRLRPSDVFARYGGEEFVILLPETDLTGAQTFADQIRKKLAQGPLEAGATTVAVTASFGVAEREAGAGATTLLTHADACLYEAKAAGRNTVRPAADATTMP